MKTALQSVLLSATLAASLCACSIAHAPPQAVYDLGNAVTAMPRMTLPPLAVAAPTVPSWLDNVEMIYRLNYANDLQLHPYANSRWSAPPMQLFEQRLKTRIAESGGQVLSASESANNVPLILHVDADDFTQAFDRVNHSVGRIALRISLFDGRKLVAQTTVLEQEDADAADAPGGARALTHASDKAIADIVRWLAGLNLKA